MAEVTASRLQPGMATGNPVLRLDTALFTRRGITDLPMPSIGWPG